MLALFCPCTLGLQAGRLRLHAGRPSRARSRPVLLVVDTARLIEENERLIRFATRLKGVGEAAEGIKARLQEARVQEAKLEARLQEVTLARRALEEEALEEETGTEGHEVSTAARRSALEPEPHRAQSSAHIAHRQPVAAVSSWFDAGLRLTPEAEEPVVVGPKAMEQAVEPAVAVSSWFDAGLRLTPEAEEPVAVEPEPVVEAVVPSSSCYDDAGLRQVPRQRVAHRPPGRPEEATEPAVAPTIEAVTAAVVAATATPEAAAATIEATTEVAEPSVQVAEPTVEVATSEESAESWISCGRDASGVRLAPPQAPATETAAPEARDLLSPPPPPPPKWQHVQADKHGFHHW